MCIHFPDMEDKESIKEVELAKRGVDAFVDRANELHHQGRHIDALKQLEVYLSMGGEFTDFVCVIARAKNLRKKTWPITH